MHSRRVPACAAAIVAVFVGLPASAGTLTINLDHEFSGATAPSGAGPWARAVFADMGAGVVRLTMTQLLNSSGEFLAKTRYHSGTMKGGWYFNLDDDYNPDNLNFSHVSGEPVTGGVPVTGTNAFRADGDGWFDIQFGFDGGLDFGQAPVVYDITIDGGGLNVGFFNFISVDGPPGKNGFLSATHVQGLAQGQSGWIANKNPGDLEVVPLPTAGGMGLAGLLALGMRRRGSRVR